MPSQPHTVSAAVLCVAPTATTPTARFCYDGKVYDTASNACVTPGTAIP